MASTTRMERRLRELRRLEPRIRPSEVPDREHSRGYGVMALPFDSGHVLALRAMPENDFAPFVAVWHRTPSGRWSMYVDGPLAHRFRPHPRASLLAGSGTADIDVSWTGGPVLRVRMDDPRLDWTVRLRSSPLTRMADRVLPRISLDAYRNRAALAVIRTLAERALGTDPTDLGGTVPGGQPVLVRPRRLFVVGDSRATLDGTDLGSPVRWETNPATGSSTESFPWPARGVLAEGDVSMEIDDRDLRERRRSAFRAAREGLRSRAAAGA